MRSSRRTCTSYVEFRNVDFAYDPGRLVLKQVNFTVTPGQTMALVGKTGSGKSSIINLLSKFYLPTAGEVLIDGIEIRRLKGEALHHRMGMVLQQNFLFFGTVADNIRVGKPDATEQEIRDVLKRLDCEDLVEDLPQGIRTTVGERGVTISVGQRQLICFARALIADPRILILDEATSSIDSHTEMRLQRLSQSCSRAERASSSPTASAPSATQTSSSSSTTAKSSSNAAGTGNSLQAGGIYAGLYPDEFVQSHLRGERI